MSNPTRKEIIAMHRSLNRLCDLAAETSSASAGINEKIVRDALPPLPKATMADIGWNDRYSLVEAEHPNYGKVPMLAKYPWNDLIGILIKDDGEFETLYVEPETLTLTGRRYILEENEDDAR